MTDAKPDLLALAQSALTDLKRDQEYAEAFDVPIRYYIETAAALAEGVVELTRTVDTHINLRSADEETICHWSKRAEAAEARLSEVEMSLSAAQQAISEANERIGHWVHRLSVAESQRDEAYRQNPILREQVSELQKRLAEVERELAEAHEWITTTLSAHPVMCPHPVMTTSMTEEMLERHRSRQEKTTTKDKEE